MKVIEENTGFDVDGKCHFCKSRLSINTFDLKIGWFNVYFICPICNKKICIPDEDLYLFGLHRKDDFED